jgi:hypothetical protein
MRYAFLLALFLALPAQAQTHATVIARLLDGVTATGAGTITTPPISATPWRSYQGSVTGTGAVTATMTVEVSNNPTLQGWMTLCTITLTGTTTATDGCVGITTYGYVRGNLTAVSGTSATVYLTEAK